ncbi:hypothetical protein 0305phi8-36p206 [Bacillus phage 0305phi8-36]|uniref:hypothetical protein n=1 Tax=Bacillus phage 0305phi8-36 TaxID=458639 RepID=UPI00015A1F3E|nr:hypothetical protein ST0305phi8-36p206 [Bacillus phage 0305phi8-36]ABS83764.1 hypothetical protein 0305phi8-36p206 [Bacillus phage 0305phi8-36]
MADLQARLSPKRDKDIIDAFENIEDRSKRLRQLVRYGLKYEAMMRLDQKTIPTPPLKPKPKEQIKIRMPGVTSASEGVVIDNILAGFD